MGPFRNAMKGAYCSELNSEQLLFNDALKYFCCFRDIRSQKYAVLAP